MKTVELIRQLQEADPSGELEVSVGLADVWFVGREPWYYDGTAQVLVRDEDLRHFNLIGGRYNVGPDKVIIRLMSFSDLISMYPKLPIDYSGLGEVRAAEFAAIHDRIRQQSLDLDRKIERDLFVEWVVKRLDGLYDDLDHAKSIATRYYDDNLSPDDSFSLDIKSMSESYNSRRQKQWDRDVGVHIDGVEIKIVPLAGEQGSG